MRELCVFTADLGGLLGLFLGGSAISVFEVIDLIIYNLAIQAQTFMKRDKQQKVAPSPGSAAAGSEVKASKITKSPASTASSKEPKHQPTIAWA
jgi:predicted lipid-binding transport protein (Tim44 family)